MSVDRVDLALDVRETSHTSTGMRAYVRALRTWLPRVAPDLRLAEFGSGDNFDLAEQVGIPLALARMKPRLVHFPTLYVPRVVTAPHVVTVHDLIDLEFPQYAKRKVGPYLRGIVGPVLRSARAVITDDDATVELLQRYLQVDPRRVRVIPLGADEPEPLPDPIVRARPYLFYAGNHRPHKDLRTLIGAWASLPRELAVDLLMTGSVDVPYAPAPRVDGELVVLGDRSEADVWRFHRGAAAYVHPALREGFGLPMLEALRVGTPVLAAEPAVPQALRPYVHRFPAGDRVALRTLIERVLRDPHRFARGAQAARAATARFTWEHTAALTAGVYRELLGRAESRAR